MNEYRLEYGGHDIMTITARIEPVEIKTGQENRRERRKKNRLLAKKDKRFLYAMAIDSALDELNEIYN